MPTVKIGPDEDVKVLAMHRDGVTATDIAATLRVGRAAVMRSLLRSGVVTPLRGGKQAGLLTADLRQQIVVLHNEGSGGALISRMLGVPRRTVYSSLRDSGIQELHRDMHRKYVPPEQIQEMVAAYVSGASFEEISATQGLPITLVRRRIGGAGVAARPKGFRRGKDHHAWAGGRTITGSGYAMVRVYKDDPLFRMASIRAGDASYALEHRIVMAQKLGRPLEDYETVHHIDGNKLNNDIDNLQLRIGRHGKGNAYRCLDCGSCNVAPVEIEETA